MQWAYRAAWSRRQDKASTYLSRKKLHKTHTKTQHTEHSDVYVQIFQSETVKPVKVYKLTKTCIFRTGMSPLPGGMLHCVIPLWHVNSCSGVATSVSELLYPCYFTLPHFKAVVLCHNKIILKNFIPEPPPSVDRPIFYFMCGSIIKWNKILLKNLKCMF